MKTAELRDKTETELKTELVALLKEQFSLKMQRGAGQMTKHDLFKKGRKQIARIKTILNERRGA